MVKKGKNGKKGYKNGQKTVKKGKNGKKWSKNGLKR